MAMEMEFDTNSAVLRPQYREELRKVVNFMKANPRVTATVEGHTSNQQGTAAQSMKLSQERAQSVVNAMADMGVERTRLFSEGFGQTVSAPHMVAMMTTERPDWATYVGGAAILFALVLEATKKPVKVE